MATSIARLKRGPGTLSGINHVDSTRREYSSTVSAFSHPRTLRAVSAHSVGADTKLRPTKSSYTTAETIYEATYDSVEPRRQYTNAVS